MPDLPMLEMVPQKPPWGDPCNGCGRCCQAEVCKVGVALHGRVKAPCPSLEYRAGRFWCGAVTLADEIGQGDSLRFLMGIGVGCDSEFAL